MTTAKLLQTTPMEGKKDGTLALTPLKELYNDFPMCQQYYLKPDLVDIENFLGK